MTKIAWTDKVWNPIAGCSIASAGCRNCYAMQMAYRLERMGMDKYAGLTHEVNGKHVWTGEVRLDEAALELPLRWRKPHRVFVNSMSDLFHPGVPDDWIDRIVTIMRRAPQHTYQVLTKRPERMAQYCQDNLSVSSLENVWWGVSAEDDKMAQKRIPHLEHIPLKARRFVSYEPALGPIRWQRQWAEFIDQIIIGAESGPQRRPFDMQWAWAVRDYCLEHGIALFFKQGSGLRSGTAPYLIDEEGRAWHWQQWPDDFSIPDLVGLSKSVEQAIEGRVS